LTDMSHAWKREDMHTKFWFENLKERDHMEDLGRDDRIILDQILWK